MTGQRRQLTKFSALGPEDAATLRALHASELASRQPQLAPAHYNGSIRRGRTVTSVARLMEDLASEQSTDSATFAQIAETLRAILARTPTPPPSPGDVSPISLECARGLLDAWLRDAHAYGYTLECLGAGLDVTRERARQRIARARPTSGVPPVVGRPRVPEDLPWPTVPKPWKRLPRPVLSETEAAELIALHRLGSQLRGRVAAGDPRRAASEELTRRIAELIDVEGFTYNEVGAVLGISMAGVRARLQSRGYRNAPPSMRQYQGAGVVLRAPARAGVDT